MASEFGHEDITRVLLQAGSKYIPNKVAESAQFCVHYYWEGLYYTVYTVKHNQ